MGKVSTYVRKAKMPKVFSETIVREYPKKVTRKWLVKKMKDWFKDQRYEVEVERDEVSGKLKGIIGFKKGIKIALEEQFSMSIKQKGSTTRVKLKFWGRTQKKAGVIAIASLGSPRWWVPHPLPPRRSKPRNSAVDLPNIWIRSWL
ncbi:MAG: hypothetical protein QGH40_09875 [bacterium]|jgi:hypothetical protein|nr:hypothetical protein [bacterium]